jgi:eukaryotic-like serine/threonine-protein kinase
MAPEQFRNAKGVDIRGDIYSLGATLYAMVTGQVPFENASPLDCWMKKIHNEFSSPKELNPAISDRVDWAIRRAMSAEPDRRPSSCREFLEDLTGQSRTTPTGQGASQAPAPGNADIWYLVYKDENWMSHTVKGSTEGIRKALQDQLLGDAATILVSRTKTGQFTLLMSVPEFRDLVVSPAPLPTPGGVRSASGSGVISHASGVIPRPGPASGRYRRQPDDGVVDVGTPPPDGGGEPASRVSRSGGPPSGRMTPPTKQTPTSAASGRRTVVPAPQTADPKAETRDYSTGPTPLSTPTPTRQPASTRKPSQAQSQKKEFDWTPILMVVVMLLSAAIGYVILKR